MNPTATTTAPPEVPVPFRLFPPTRTTPGIDVDLIGALAHLLPAVAARPDDGTQGTSLYQAAWRCGTSQCTAGWVRALTGVPWAGEDNHPGHVVQDGVDVADVLLAGPVYPEDPYSVLDPPMHVEQYARYRLGITMDQASVLFAGSRTLPQILALLDAFRGGMTSRDALIDLCHEVDPWAPISERIPTFPALPARPSSDREV